MALNMMTIENRKTLYVTSKQWPKRLFLEAIAVLNKTVF
jgi:hypothetical protein